MKEKSPAPGTPTPSATPTKSQYPKIVVMPAGQDVFKDKVRENYLALYVKLHELYSTEKIFAMAWQAAVDFEKYWKELNTHVNVNFEEDIEKYAGPEALKEIKALYDKDKSKNKTRRSRD
jgi:hypothetical protein